MADPTYMDCWNFIVPLIPIDNETARQVYIMTFMALQKAEKRRKKQ